MVVGCGFIKLDFDFVMAIITITIIVIIVNTAVNKDLS